MLPITHSAPTLYWGPVLQMGPAKSGNSFKLGRSIVRQIDREIDFHVPATIYASKRFSNFPILVAKYIPGCQKQIFIVILDAF